MKWLFLINSAPFLMEFMGKFASEVINEGNECIGVISNKIAEYEEKQYFPNEMKFISGIDWCIKNYQKEKKEFGNLSWKELFPNFDRCKQLDFNYNNSLRMVSQFYQFFDFLFQKEKPDVVIGEPQVGLFHSIAYYFCKINNIPFIGLTESIFNNRMCVYDLEFTCSKYEKTFKEINRNNISEKEKEFAKDFIEKFISHKQVPSYVGLAKIYFTQFGIIKHYLRRIKELGRTHFQYFLNRKQFKEFDYESENIFKNSLWAPFEAEKRKFRILFQKNIFSHLSNLDSNQKFFLFPLHLQPEASTSVLATYFCDQLNTIRNIAFALPFPYKLYVRENPYAVGIKPRSFYKQLKQLPNVDLISPNENIENLIKKSSGVITLTSTIGIEAALAGKLVYVLGNVFYSYHPLCQKVKSFGELKEKIEMDLINNPNRDNLEDINYRFVVSYFRNTIEGSIILAVKEKDTNNYKLIYQDMIKNFLRENYSN